MPEPKENGPKVPAESPIAARPGGETVTVTATGTSSHIRDLLKPADAGNAEREPFGKRARAAFATLQETYGASGPEAREIPLELLQQLLAFFAEREAQPEGDENFTLKNMHNMLVRNFDNDRFLRAVLAYVSAFAEYGRAFNKPVYTQLAMKAREFEANRKRRVGFDLLQKAAKEPREDDPRVAEGTGLVDDAKQKFGEILQHWRGTGDADSQSRVLYELGMIAWERGDWEGAATAQLDSAAVAEATGKPVAGIVARITAASAQVRGALRPGADLAAELEHLTAETRRLAKEGDDTPLAQRWVSNALAHQAEACIIAAKEAIAGGDMAAAARWKEQALACCDAVINDTDGYLAALGESRALPERMAKLRADVEALTL